VECANSSLENGTPNSTVASDYCSNWPAFAQQLRVPVHAVVGSRCGELTWLNLGSDLTSWLCKQTFAQETYVSCAGFWLEPLTGSTCGKDQLSSLIQVNAIKA